MSRENLHSHRNRNSCLFCYTTTIFVWLYVISFPLVNTLNELGNCEGTVIWFPFSRVFHSASNHKRGSCRVNLRFSRKRWLWLWSYLVSNSVLLWVFMPAIWFSGMYAEGSTLQLQEFSETDAFSKWILFHSICRAKYIHLPTQLWPKIKFFFVI